MAKIQIITAVPGETRGDAYSTKKLIDILKAKYPDSFDEIEWVIIRNKPIDDLNLPENVKVKYVKNWKQIDNTQDFELYIIYPQIPATYLGLNPEVVEYLERIPYRDRILLSCTEYNASDKSIELHESLQKHYPIVQKLETGFNNLGIYIDPPSDPDILLKDFQESAPEIADMVFSNDSESEYFDHTHLYFGYLNVSFENRTSAHNKIDRVNYALTCIRDALHANTVNKTNKDIDIIIDHNERSFLDKVLEQLTYDERKALSQIEMRSIYDDDITEEKSQTDNHGINLRFINAFPMPHSAMLYLIAKSNPLTMLTGDQSLTEGLIYDKIIFYQLMDWKEKLFDKFLEEIENFCTENKLDPRETILYQFYSLQKEASTKEEFWHEALKMYHAHQKQLLEQQKQFSLYLHNIRNLNENFPDAILNVLNLDPLLKASALGDIQFIEEYNTRNNTGVDLPRDTYGNTALMLASKNDKADCVQALISAGAKTEIRNNLQSTPLLIAVENKSLNSVRVLLGNNAQIPKSLIDSAWHYILTKMKPNVSVDDSDKLAINFLLIRAQSNQALTEFISQRDQNLNLNLEEINTSIINGDSLLITAIKANRHDIIEDIKSTHTNNAMNQADKNGITPFMYAVIMGHDKVVSAILAHMTEEELLETYKANQSSLYIAVKFGHLQVAEIICQKWPQIIDKQVNNIYPIELAVRNNNIDMVKTLASYSQDQDILSKKYGWDQVPLAIYAAQMSHTEMMLFFLNEHEDVNSPYKVKMIEKYIDGLALSASDDEEVEVDLGFIKSILIKLSDEELNTLQDIVDDTMMQRSYYKQVDDLIVSELNRRYKPSPRHETKQVENINNDQHPVEVDLSILLAEIRKKVNYAIIGRENLTEGNVINSNKLNPNPHVDSYLSWMDKNARGTRGITRFSHWYHGDSGKERAIKLLELVNSPNANLTEIYAALDKILDKSSFHKHSLRQYLVATLDENNLADIRNLSVDYTKSIKIK